MSSDWWMSAEWAARDEQPILPTSTNPVITRAAGTQGVNTRTEVIRLLTRLNSMDRVRLMYNVFLWFDQIGANNGKTGCSN